MTENNSSKTYVAGVAVIVVILGLVLLPLMIERDEDETVAKTSGAVEELDVDALQESAKESTPGV